MVLKLYAVHHAGGPRVIVALLLAEKQIPFELVVVDMAAKQHKTPEYLAMHPFGQVPVIDDDGFIVYESRAICLKERAMVEQAAAVESASFDVATRKALVELYGKKRRGLPVDQAVVDEALAQISAILDGYEVILGKHKFLAGDDFSLADLFHYALAPALAEEGIDIMTTKGPNVARWWSELISRPTWVKLKADGIKGTV
ncbi:Glutathione S-transferase [Mycena venus]|uniref:glutathione transferase n=1 Tax=Mycena venus TaxID=2733690 RepID=A0A8H7D868_9AGAR|nr:Glutathione S-transferase [Mycena venus]